MANLDKIKVFETVKKTNIPQISNYEIIRDQSFIGFKNRISWEYTDQNIFGFRVWRAVSKKVLLKRNYVIPQVALERLTGLKTFYTQNTALYNKQFYSLNSKVKFETSNGSDRFVKKDETSEIDFHRFTEIGFVRKHKKNKYHFVDKKVKFGETYLYVISALTTGFFDSGKSKPVTVRMEDLEHPDEPTNIKLKMVSNGVLITIGTSIKANDVKQFNIFRREESEQEFKKISNLQAYGELEFINFLDLDLIPGKVYYYKVYSEDFYGNLNFSSKEHKIIYSSAFNNKKDTPFPDITVKVDGNVTTITGIKNNDNIIGYRVERNDSWRFEKGFNIKTYLGKPWPNVNIFDESGKAELIDKTTTSNRTYQYRISSIQKNGRVSTYLVTPHIRIEDGFEYKSVNNKDKVGKVKTDLVDFNVSIEDIKQFPIFTKIQWHIQGNWSYLLLEIKKGIAFGGPTKVSPQIIKVKIDNVHKDNNVYYTELEKGNSYEIKAQVFDADNNLLDETTTNQATRITI